MNIDQLRSKQAIFEIDRKKIDKEYLEMEKIRNSFISTFSLEKIKNLLIDEYVVGKRSKKSFCFLLENALKPLGDIHGATSFKFGVYYSKENNDYLFVKKFGDNYKLAFDNVKDSIFSLIIAGKNTDYKSIKSNLLSPMFKGKILSTYFPEQYLSIFSEDHLDHFLDQFNINYKEKDDVLEKREYLLEFKNKDLVMKNWRNYDFLKFLYFQIGRPPKLESNTPGPLKEYSIINFPKIKNVKYEFIDLELSDTNKISTSQDNENKILKKIDFDKENKINKKIGERGEEVVLRAEKELLYNLGLDSLSKKVKQRSRQSDSYGYDILSFNKDGTEKYIEVKSTKKKSSSNNLYFAISSNEYKHALDMDDYYIYIVFEVDTVNPKILRLYKPFNKPNQFIKIEPKSYKVSFNLSQKEDL